VNVFYCILIYSSFYFLVFIFIFRIKSLLDRRCNTRFHLRKFRGSLLYFNSSVTPN